MTRLVNRDVGERAISRKERKKKLFFVILTDDQRVDFFLSASIPRLLLF
jgi:hypothetical protein